MKKQPMSEKILLLSKDLSLHKRDIQYIIWNYLELKQNEIFSGMRIKIGNIVEIEPYPIKNYSISSLAYTANILSDKISYSYTVIYTVLSCYLKMQEEIILQGRHIDFRGIVKIHPTIENNKIKNIHSSISVSLSSKIYNSQKIDSARVHTSKYIKQIAYGKTVNIQNYEIEDDIDFEIIEV